ncbi:MAG: hypothetical protein MI862_11285 [Desulfobacterales bacterium]|nr:hypothetical protein [Desulfobacterales bacterium]
MDRFGFTKRKWLKLGEKTRHRQMIRYLSVFFQAVSGNRITSEKLDQFTAQYNQVLSWTGSPPFIPPRQHRSRVWLESISNRIHEHRMALGIPCRDPDLLIRTTDGIDTEEGPGQAGRINFDCHVALDGLRSLFNTGSIIRSCEAAGFKSVILGNMPDRNHAGLQKTAMGAEKWINMENTNDLAQTLFEKKASGYTVIGVETVKGAKAYDRFDWCDRTVLVFGNEEYGISSHVLPACDAFVQIPMLGRKNSINVANAVSVVCFHAARALTVSRR